MRIGSEIQDDAYCMSDDYDCVIHLDGESYDACMQHICVLVCLHVSENLHVHLLLSSCSLMQMAAYILPPQLIPFSFCCPYLMKLE